MFHIGLFALSGSHEDVREHDELSMFIAFVRVYYHGGLYTYYSTLCTHTLGLVRITLVTEVTCPKPVLHDWVLRKAAYTYTLHSVCGIR